MNLDIFCSQASLNEIVLRVVTIISILISLLHLKATFTKLVHIRVQIFSSFNQFSDVFTKIKFHLSNVCDLFS